MVELNVFGDYLWMCFGECVWIEFGNVAFRQGSELTLIPNMMYLPRVKTQT